MSAQVGTNEHSVIFGLIKMNCGHPVVTMSVAIQKDFTWKLHAHGHSFDHSSLLGCFPFAWPSSLCSCFSIYEVLHVLGTLTFCPGIPDEKFVPLVRQRKGTFMDQSGMCLYFNEKEYSIIYLTAL